ncbi:MAG: hypothetical protein QXI91_02245 [Candidatus Bathyarchaeia archaeon]
MNAKKLAILLVVVVLSVSLTAYTLANAQSDPYEWHIIEEKEGITWDGDVSHIIWYRNGRGDEVLYCYYHSNKSALYVDVFPAEGGVLSLNATWEENLLRRLTTRYFGVGWSGSIVRMPSLPPGFKLPPRPPECN